MGKRLILGLWVVGMIVAVAGPAQAKGPFDHPVTLSGTVSIHDSDNRGGAIFLKWRGDCGIIEPCSDIKELSNDFLIVADDTAVMGRVPRYARNFYALPSRARLGPAFTVDWSFTADDGVTATLTQTLYPYAPGRPWVHMAPGQSFFGMTLEGGWSTTPPSMVGLLRSYGLPRTAPGVPPAAPVAAPAVAGTSAPWVWSIAIAALIALVVGGAAAGRRRAALRTA